jgi:dihydroneopterin aldolase
VGARSVVKLGGSHAFAETLGAWLSAIKAGAGKAVLVAGGGPFADAVRVAQRRMHFDDRAADEMALLAMEQYAIAIAAFGGGPFAVADSRSGIDSALRDGLVPIWAPRFMVRKASDIPASWEVTSDSLAAWLAGAVGARSLILIKRVDPGGPVSSEALSASGIVDPAFPRFLAASGVPGFLLGPGEDRALAEALRIGAPAGRFIDPGPAARSDASYALTDAQCRQGSVSRDDKSRTRR